MCVVCVNTTRWHLPHLNNSGTFDEAQERLLETQIDQLKRRPGIDLDDAIWLLLAHHHPLPTIKSQTESMLYMKNAGQLLRFAVRHGVRLILHGHQHDPHFTKVSFGSDHDDDMIGILSAGSCCKAEENATEPSGTGHLYTVTIDSTRADIASFYHHREEGRLVELGGYAVTRASTVEPRLTHFDQRFEVTGEGHMAATEKRSYVRTRDGTCVIAIGIGVDEYSGACDQAGLGLSVEVDGRPATAEFYLDQPLAKRFRIQIPGGRRNTTFNVSFAYRWPDGFRTFLNKHSDSGDFSIRAKGLEWCRTTIKLGFGTRYLKPIRVYYADPGSVAETLNSDGSRSFTITKPRPNSHVSWAVTTEPSIPPVV